MTDEVAVTPARAAELLGVSERTLDELEAEGLIRRVDFGKRRIRRFAVDELRRFAARTHSYTRHEEDHDEETLSRRPTAITSKRRPVPAGRPDRKGKSRSSGAPLPLRDYAG